jgi:coenzyme F420-dependent glucose-6-phosphate dehydrogenase
MSVTRPLVFGYKASAEQFAGRPLLEFAVAAEEYGFDSVVVSDHFQPWKHTGGHAPFSLAWLAALGERTSRVRIGTSVLTPTFRYHPSIVAQALGTLGSMYPGRVFLGVGTGESLNEVAPLGIEWPPFQERFDRLKESIELMKLLWTQERVTYRGKYFRTKAATVYDRPEQAIPLYIAATGAVAARLAGRVADGFICTSGKQKALYAETLLPAVEEGTAKAYRDSDSVELAIEMKVSFDPNPDYALQQTRHWAALALTSEEKMDRFQRSGRTRRTHPGVHRPRFHAPYVPRSGARSNALPEALFGTSVPAAAERGRTEGNLSRT